MPEVFINSPHHYSEQLASGHPQIRRLSSATAWETDANVKEIDAYQVYILANPRSGSQQAVYFINLKEKDIEVPLSNGKIAYAHIYNLIEREQQAKCYQDMLVAQRDSKYCYYLINLATKINRLLLCIAGGDGSLISILKAAKDAGVDID